MSELQQWLADHPAISIRMIEAESGIPTSSLGKYLRGARKFPPKYIEQTIKVLRRYDYKGETI